MTLKKYKMIRAIIAVLVGVLVVQSLALRSSVLPFIVIASAMMILFYLRGRLKNEVLSDERDYEIGGRAARWAIQVFSLIAAVIMIIFYAKQDLNPLYLPVASTLAYSTCALMFLYSVIFGFLRKK